MGLFTLRHYVRLLLPALCVEFQREQLFKSLQSDILEDKLGEGQALGGFGCVRGYGAVWE